MGEDDLHHIRNVTRDALRYLPPHFGPPVVSAVVAYYEDGTAIADSPLKEAVPPGEAFAAAERIIEAVDRVAAGNPGVRTECLDAVREIAGLT